MYYALFKPKMNRSSSCFRYAPRDIKYVPCRRGSRLMDNKEFPFSEQQLTYLVKTININYKPILYRIILGICGANNSCRTEIE